MVGDQPPRSAIALRQLTLLLVALAAMARAAPGQVPVDSLRRGAEVRLWSDAPPLNGWKLEYLGRTDTSIVFAERKGSAHVAGFRNEIAYDRIQRLELNRGKDYDAGRIFRKTLKGGGIGFLAGAALIGAAVASGPDNDGDAVGIVVVPLFGASVGGIVGGILGMRGATQWTPVRLGGER
jgi:hypothetical protein